MEASAVPRLAPTGVAAFASPGLLRLLSDDRLVVLVRDGHANAFEALYDRHHRAILSFCRHMLGCPDEAEDAVQHTFLSAYNDLISSRKTIHLRAWLFTIARNRCLSILRARHDRTSLEPQEQSTDGLAAQVQRRQDLRDLVVDINQLPENQRAALVLAEIGALSHDEIGSVIGVPKVKVKALVYQARESLLASRAARDTDCLEIREQLATMRGGALRRTTLRRHLRECQGCRDYRRLVEGQRRRLALILPVAPTIALREAVVGATAGGGVAGLAGGGMLGTSSMLKGFAGKAMAAAVLAAVGTTGTIIAVHDIRLHAATAPLGHGRGAAETNVLARSAVPLALRSGLSAPGSAAGSVITTAGSTGLGVVVWPGHGSAAARALVRSLTGQLSNLLNPVSPRGGGHGSGAGGPKTGPVNRPQVAPVVAPVLPTPTGVIVTPPTPAPPHITSAGGPPLHGTGHGAGGSGSGPSIGSGSGHGSLPAHWPGSATSGAAGSGSSTTASAASAGSGRSYGYGAGGSGSVSVSSSGSGHGVGPAGGSSGHGVGPAGGSSGASGGSGSGSGSGAGGNHASGSGVGSGSAGGKGGSSGSGSASGSAGSASLGGHTSGAASSSSAGIGRSKSSGPALGGKGSGPASAGGKGSGPALAGGKGSGPALAGGKSSGPASAGGKGSGPALAGGKSSGPASAGGKDGSSTSTGTRPGSGPARLGVGRGLGRH